MPVPPLDGTSFTCRRLETSNGIGVMIGYTSERLNLIQHVTDGGARLATPRFLSKVNSQGDLLMHRVFILTGSTHKGAEWAVLDIL